MDIREYYEKDGELRPGKKGISLTPDQWEVSKKITGGGSETKRKRAGGGEIK